MSRIVKGSEVRILLWRDQRSRKTPADSSIHIQPIHPSTADGTKAVDTMIVVCIVGRSWKLFEMFQVTMTRPEAGDGKLCYRRHDDIDPREDSEKP